MSFEIDLFNKDSVKINMLKNVLSGKERMTFQLNDDSPEDYATKIHKDGNRVQVYGKFNLSEDPSGETITIRPVMVDTKLTVTITSSGSSGNYICVYRSATKSVDKEIPIDSDSVTLVFVPQGKQKYVLQFEDFDTAFSQSSVQFCGASDEVETTSVFSQSPDASRAKLDTADNRFESHSFNSIPDRTQEDRRFASYDIDSEEATKSNVSGTVNPVSVNNALHPHEVNTESEPLVIDSELQRIEAEISVIERQKHELAQKKKSAVNHLEMIEAEYKKDYATLEQELDEIKSRMESDASIIEYYKDQEVMPVEIIFQEIKLKLEDAEKQIRFFIEAKQRKTMDIEGEIKSNKSQ